jgi:CheY-like chemotaxis protein
MNMDLLVRTIASFGFTTESAVDGKQAVDMVRMKTYDLILMDHMMPDPDGYETMKIIRAAGGHNSKIPVIVLTANAIEGAKQKYLDMGFDGYLSKPVLGKELEDMLIRFLPEDKVHE